MRPSRAARQVLRYRAGGPDAVNRAQPALRRYRLPDDVLGLTIGRAREGMAFMEKRHPRELATTTYLVVQWATGNIGTRSLRSVIEHPRLDLAGVYVHSPDKADGTPGELCAGWSPPA